MNKLLNGLATAATAALFAACTQPKAPEAPALTASGLNPEQFADTINGKATALYTLKNASGMEVCITNFGGRVVSIMVPDRDGNFKDVVLGYDNVAQYADAKNSPSDYGSSIGRYANRISKHSFDIDGQHFELVPTMATTACTADPQDGNIRCMTHNRPTARH